MDVKKLDKHDREHLLLFATVDMSQRDKTFQIYTGIVERLERYGLVTLAVPRGAGLNSVTVLTPGGPMVVTVTAEGRSAAAELLGEKAK